IVLVGRRGRAGANLVRGQGGRLRRGVEDGHPPPRPRRLGGQHHAGAGAGVAHLAPLIVQGPLDPRPAALRRPFEVRGSEGGGAGARGGAAETGRTRGGGASGEGEDGCGAAKQTERTHGHSLGAKMWRSKGGT